MPELLQRVVRAFPLRFHLPAAFLYISTAIVASNLALAQQFAPPGPGIAAQVFGEGASTPGVYLPTDRTVSRAVTRARERLANGEYQEALTYLHDLLGKQEDWFFDGAGGAAEQRGIKATARQLIGDLPKEGQDAYELLYGASARRQLEAALATGNRKDIAQVVRQFFHTMAGYEAALILAQIEADQGRRLAAAQIYRELLDAPRAVAVFDPQLSLLAAANYLGANDRESADNTMRSLIKRMPNAEVMLAGKKVPLPAGDDRVVAWMEEYVGKSNNGVLEESNWLVARGNTNRNSQHPGGKPHLRPRWQARVANDPRIESYLTGRSNDYIERGVAMVPRARPIAVGDLIVMRTPRNVVAIDFNSGKRVWETREDEDSPNEEVLRVDQEQWPAQSNSLEQRVWDDGLAMSLSSDGERVFVLRGAGSHSDEDMMAVQMGGVFGRQGQEVRAITNQLAAYDIKTQGKLLWELGGSQAQGPLHGAYFLGAPLSIDGTLYVMAEIRSAIYLFALDAATGGVQWQQQLIGLEQSVWLNPVRRLAGASPSYSAGLLICPTNSSAVVAIDIGKREFAWVYRYAREEVMPTEGRGNWQHQVPSAAIRSNDRWLDSSIVIGDGHVFITPPESSELHCLDLLTGKLAWKRRQGESLYVGGVTDGKVLLIGVEGAQALRVSDASIAWPRETVPFPDNALPAGQGYMSDGRYYLPLTSGEIAEINMDDGALATRSAPNTEGALGNLICHRGSVLSQSVLLLDKFEQLDLLKQRVEGLLAANPNDAGALRELAELRRTAGQTDEAVALLKQAYGLAPEDRVVQESLGNVLLEALAADYTSFRDDLPLLHRLINDREKLVELMRVEASGLERTGQSSQAVDAYLQLADLLADGPVQLRVAPTHSVRSDRWIGGRLGEIWRKADAGGREQVAQRIDTWRRNLGDDRSLMSLRHGFVHLQELPMSKKLHERLIDALLEHHRFDETEIELLGLSYNEGNAITVAKLIERLEERRGTSSHEKVSWPAGQVEAKLLPLVNNAADEQRNPRNPAEQQMGLRPLRIEQRRSLEPSPVSWFVASDGSELVGQDPLGNDVIRLGADRTRQMREATLQHGAELGPFLFVVHSGRLMAVRASGSPGQGSELLWQTDPYSRYFANSTLPRRGSSEANGRVNRRPVYHLYSGRRRISGNPALGVCGLGPVTPRGVVYQEQDHLRCVDPLSGEPLWVRTDIPPGCELFGDDEFLLAADSGMRVAHIIRMVDGEVVGKRELSKHEWLLTVGRKVVEVELDMRRENRRMMIYVRDMVTGEVLSEEQFPIASKVAVLEPDKIGVFQSDGHFWLYDVGEGVAKIDTKLDPLNSVQNIHLLPTDERLFLIVSGSANSQYKPVSQQQEYPIVDGFVYAFDRESGKPVWPGPAVLRNRGAILYQPADIPILVFADRKSVRNATNGGSMQLRVLCLDRATGETVYRNDALADTSITRFRIRGSQDMAPTVAIDTNAGKIQLTMTDRPRPPRPPANDDLETKPLAEEHGLRGIGKRIGGALQGAVENPSRADRQWQEIEARRLRLQEFQEAQKQRFRIESGQPVPAIPEQEAPIDDD